MHSHRVLAELELFPTDQRGFDFEESDKLTDFNAWLRRAIETSSRSERDRSSRSTMRPIPAFRLVAEPDERLPNWPSTPATRSRSGRRSATPARDPFSEPFSCLPGSASPPTFL